MWITFVHIHKSPNSLDFWQKIFLRNYFAYDILFKAKIALLTLINTRCIIKEICGDWENESINIY